MCEPKEILLRYNEAEQAWEKYKEPFVTIECPTEEDYNRFKELVELGKRMQWHPADVDFPTDEMLAENGEFIVMIRGASNPTTLLYDQDYGVWCTDYEDTYSVDWWMPLPVPPKKEDDHETD